MRQLTPVRAAGLAAGRPGPGRVVFDPDVGLYAGRMVVFGVAVDRHQRAWRDHIAGMAE
jgi:hypothetical protein